MNIYSDANSKRRVILLALFTDPEEYNCFSIYQLDKIGKSDFL